MLRPTHVIDAVRITLPAEDGESLGGDCLGNPFARLDGAGAKVRRVEYARVAHQRMVGWWRLLLIHIDRCPSEVASIERVRQRC